jgi:hypothetical protein
MLASYVNLVCTTTPSPGELHSFRVRTNVSKRLPRAAIACRDLALGCPVLAFQAGRFKRWFALPLHPQPIATRATSQNKSRRVSWGSFMVRSLDGMNHRDAEARRKPRKTRTTRKDSIKFSSFVSFVVSPSSSLLLCVSVPLWFISTREADHGRPKGFNRIGNFANNCRVLSGQREPRC